jgi:hypothetical protein
MRKLLANHIKNIKGKKIKRKLLAFSVDDYGNIRLSSKLALEKLQKNGVKLNGRFDYFDALDTKEDFEMLFDVLGSVKDSNGKPAIFTPYAMSCNVNFEKSLDYGAFVSERLDETYKNLSVGEPVYEGAYKLLLEGIKVGFLKPQFHGREHLNVNLFNKLLSEGNLSLLANLQNRCLAGVPSHKNYPNVNFNEAFSFWKSSEIELHKEIIRDGLKQFNEVYGYESKTFTPPAMQLHPDLNQFVSDMGIIGLDKNRVDNIHLGEGRFLREKSFLGEYISTSTLKIVRNCVFEPTDRDIDWVSFTFKQIEAAFFWNKPAIISSHRVNFCGHIDPDNRKKGLAALRALLNKVVKKWPDVEFVSVDELILIMENDE